MPSFPFPPWYLSGPNKYQFGMIVGLLSIGAFFIALALAFALIIPNQPAGVRVALPRVLWLSTGLIGASSVTFELSRYALRRGRVRPYRTRLVATLALASAFLVCQLYSWGRLAEQGITMEGNARGSAFYVFTGIHGLHLLGGIFGGWYVLRQAAAVDTASEQSLRKQRRVTGAAALYWHSMGVLWLGLFLLLIAWSA